MLDPSAWGVVRSMRAAINQRLQRRERLGASSQVAAVHRSENLEPPKPMRPNYPDYEMPRLRNHAERQREALRLSRSAHNEAKAIHERINAEGREATEEEQRRFDELMGDDGIVAKLSEVAAQAKSERDAQMRQALEQHDAKIEAGYSPSPFGGWTDSAGNEQSNDQVEERMRNSITRSNDRRPVLQDASGRPMRVAMGGERLFNAEQPTDFGAADRPRLGFGAAIQAHFRGESSQLTSVGGSGGFLVPELDSGILLDRIRAASIFDKINVANVMMDGPEVWFTQVLKDPVAYWQQELAPTKASSASIGRGKLEAHTLRCVIPMSGEWMADSINGPQIIEQIATRAFAAKLDYTYLAGSGVGPEPLGVLNTPGIQTVDDVGFPHDDAKFSAGVAAIMRADFSGDASELSLVTNPSIAGVLDNLRDNEGQPLRQTPWVDALPKFVSSSLPSNLGDDEDESKACILHGPSILIGWRRMIEGRIYDAGAVSGENGERFEAPSQDVRFLVLQARVGIAVLRPSWQCALSGILAVDPTP